MAEAGTALVLRAGGRSCAVELARVQRVVEEAAPAELPDAPEVVLGLVNVSSRVVGVLDLGLLLGGDPVGDGSVVVVVSTARGAAGLAVDERPRSAHGDVELADLDALLAPERLR